MAEYDLTPLTVDETMQGTYNLLREYFLRGNNLFNMVSDYIGEDSFTMDIVRSYSFVASTHRASVHIAGTPTEDNKTKLAFHVKSVEKQENLEREIRDRLEDMIVNTLATERAPKPEPSAQDKKRDKRKTTIAIVVLVAIALGAGVTGVLQQYSGLWSI